MKISRCPQSAASKSSYQVRISNTITWNGLLFTCNCRPIHMSQSFKAADAFLDRGMAGENTMGFGLELLNRIHQKHVGGGAISSLQDGRVVGDDPKSVGQ